MVLGYTHCSFYEARWDQGYLLYSFVQKYFAVKAIISLYSTVPLIPASFSHSSVYAYFSFRWPTCELGFSGLEPDIDERTLALCSPRVRISWKIIDFSPDMRTYGKHNAKVRLSVFSPSPEKPNSQVRRLKENWPYLSTKGSVRGSLISSPWNKKSIVTVHNRDFWITNPHYCEIRFFFANIIIFDHYFKKIEIQDVWFGQGREWWSRKR